MKRDFPHPTKSLAILSRTMPLEDEQGNGGQKPTKREQFRQWVDTALEVPAVARSVKAAMLVATGLKSDPITLRASALTYLTMLSIIPLLAVVFSVFQAIVGEAELQADLERLILENLAVGAQENIGHWISGFVKNASGTAIGGVGFALLLVSAVSLMANVEKALNHTFHAPKPRPLALRFGVYWCLLTLGPILLALSVAATALLQSSASLEWMGPVRRMVFLLAPFIVTWTGFALLYIIVPATRVHRRSAMLGAVVAGTGWELAKIGYAAFSAGSVRKNAIYGSLSAIPIFLVWVYLSWIIVLFGARIAWAVQTPGEGLGARTQTPAGRELLFCRVVLSVCRGFQAGAPLTMRQIAHLCVAEEANVRSALIELEQRGVVRELASGGWVPGKPLSRLTLNDARQAARGDGVGGVAEPGYLLLDGHLRVAEEAASDALAVTFETLVAENEPDLVLTSLTEKSS